MDKVVRRSGRLLKNRALCSRGRAAALSIQVNAMFTRYPAI